LSGPPHVFSKGTSTARKKLDPPGPQTFATISREELPRLPHSGMVHFDPDSDMGAITAYAAGCPSFDDQR
jgi:hypothetical protein